MLESFLNILIHQLEQLHHLFWKMLTFSLLSKDQSSNSSDFHQGLASTTKCGRINWQPLKEPWHLSTMSLRRFLTKIRNAEADQSSMENDRPHSYTSSVTTAPSHTLPGRVSQPENSFTDTTAPSHILPGRASVWHSLTNTLGVEESQIATTDYSKRMSVSHPNSLICVNFISILSDLRWGWSYSLEDTSFCL